MRPGGEATRLRMLWLCSMSLESLRKRQSSGFCLPENYGSAKGKLGRQEGRTLGAVFSAACSQAGGRQHALWATLYGWLDAHSRVQTQLLLAGMSNKTHRYADTKSIHVILCHRCGNFAACARSRQAVTLPLVKRSRFNPGKLVIESKQDMASRGMASPDDADALALTFAHPVEPPRPPRVQRPSTLRGLWH